MDDHPLHAASSVSKGQEKEDIRQVKSQETIGDYFLHQITGLFHESPPPPPPPANNPPARTHDPLTLPCGGVTSTASPPPSTKPANKRHERTISWGIPSVIDVNQSAQDQDHDGDQGSLVLGASHANAMPPPRPPRPPIRSHKQTMTAANMLPTINQHNNMGASPPSLPPTTTRSHSRSMTHAQLPLAGLFPSTSGTDHTMHRRNFTLLDPQDVSSLQPIAPSNNIAAAAAAAKPRINLNDVIMTAPLELEAETHILRALEEQAEDNHHRPTAAAAGAYGPLPETSTILSHIPDDTVHDFASVPSVGEGTAASASVAVGASVAVDEAEEEGMEQVFECADLQSTHSTHSNHSKQATLVAQSPVTKKEIKPLLPTPTTKPKKVHKHTKSVEQTLFGLTAAMTAMDQSNDDASESGDDDQSASSPSALPATDKLAKAANIFARRLKKEQSVRNLMVEPEKTPSVDEEVSNRMELGKTNQSTRFHNMELGKANKSTRFHVSVDEEEGRTPHVVVPTGASNSSPKINDISLTSDETEEALDGKKTDQSGHAETATGRDSAKKRTRRSIFSRTSTKLKDDWDLFSEVLSPKKVSVYLRNVFLFLIFPALGVAALLFYVFENPHTGVEGGENNEPSDKASISWWLIFLFVRQVITLTLALATQAIIIDFLAIGSWIFLRFFGPVLTLLLAQSKGWPFVLIFWGIYDLALLAGPGRLANHWGYYQDYIGLFNESNPSGNVTSDGLYIQLLQVAIGVGVAVSVKRLAIGMFLGRQTFTHFGQELASVMNKMVLVSEVAGLAQEIYKSRDEFIPHYWNVGWKAEDYQNMMKPTAAENEASKIEQQQATFQKSDRLIDLLERWEEPDRARQERKKEISISAVLQFRRAFAYMQRKYPFSSAFGPCNTRDSCIESAQKVYEKLLLRTPDKEVLNFETISLVAMNDDGSLNEAKVKDLIQVFRPDRDGSLTLLEFVKSVDNVYKSLRLLSATVQNSGTIDEAFENLLNILFSVILGCLILSFLGYDPLALFFSLSSVILAFAFMFSSASAKYFEGMIFILVQRPYGVGDLIHVSEVNSQTNPNGSSGWIVEKVTLFSTTVYWTATNEYATMSNAAIANSRIINARRSPHAKLVVTVKFGIDVPYEKIVIFKSAVEQYMKARPREWLQLVGFRASNVTVDRGFIEYNIIALHRESWQATSSIFESRATLTSYCSEVAKQLEMRYMSPSLPVSLTVATPSGKLDEQGSIQTKDKDSTLNAQRDFRSMALSHGIKIDR